MTDDPTKSPVKSFDIVDTLKRVRNIKKILNEKVDSTLSAEDFKLVFRQVLQVMPQDLLSHKVHDSVAHLFGRPLTKQIVNETAWRLAGNADILRAGEVISSDVSTAKEGWCAVQVTSCRPFLNNPRSRSHRARGCKYTAMVLTGHAAGCVVQKFLTLGQVRYLSRQLGFSPSFKKRPFRDEREFFGMRFGALFVTSLAIEGRPGFNEMHVSPSMVTWNKQILNNRYRENYSCPLLQSVEELPCFRCWKGATSCIAAVHSKDFEQDFCEFCGQESLFDPEAIGYSVGVCVNCQRNEDTTGLILKRIQDDDNRDRPS